MCFLLNKLTLQSPEHTTLNEPGRKWSNISFNVLVDLFVSNDDGDDDDDE